MNLRKLLPRLSFRPVFLLLVAELSLGFTRPCTAAVPSPVIIISSPKNADTLYNNPPDAVSNFYDPVSDTIQVFGVFSNVLDLQLRRNAVQIRINGDLVPATMQLRARRRVNGVLLRGGTFSKSIPVSYLPLWPMRGLVAEIVHKNGRALARHYISFYDLRAHADASPNLPKDSAIAGLSAQLTDRGLGFLETTDTLTGMEPIFKSLLPYPSLAEFNQKLTNRAVSIPRYDDDANQLDACVPYGSLGESRFSNPVEFPPYAEAYGEAETIYLAYDQERNLCLAIPNLILQAACLTSVESAYCVRSQPQPSDFQLCVNQIEGDVQSLQIGSVEDTALQFLEATTGARGLIGSNISLGGYQGTINGYLRSLSVRWGGAGCIPRPRGNLNDDTIAEKPWLSEWATCRNMTIRNTLVTTAIDNHPGRYEVRRDSTNHERPKVTLAAAGDFSFYDGTVDASEGTCAESFIHQAAEDMVISFRQALRTKLQNTWYSDDPDTQEAQVLTKIFAPYRLGEVPHTEHDLVANLAALSSTPFSGLQLMWSTSVSPILPALIPNQKPFSFYAVPRAPTYSESTFDHLDHRFQISIAVTTGLLNKILNVKAASPNTLHFTYAPTWAELEPFGVTRPRGRPATDPAVLNQRTLAQFDSAFRGLGRAVLQIEISPRFDPFVYMPPDTTPEIEVPSIGAPTTYGIEQLIVTFKEADRRVLGRTIRGKEWLKLYGSFVDQEFKLTLNRQIDPSFLIPHLVNDQWGTKVTLNNMTGCSMYASDSGHAGTCEGRLESKVADLLEFRLRDVFLAMLNEIPVPLLFNAEGESSISTEFENESREQSNQNIIYYGQVHRLQ